MNVYQFLKDTSKESKLYLLAEKLKNEFKKQKFDILFNKTKPVNNITLIKFKTKKYEINNIKKYCESILDKEKILGKIDSKIKDCKYTKQPDFADWSIYRESESSFVKNITTQQIIFYYLDSEFNITTNCDDLSNCIDSRKRLSQLVNSIEFGN